MGALERTIALMQSSERGGMFRAFVDESMGGNAGRENDKACIAVNFRFDITTGEIVYFGNDQNIPETIRENYQHGYFRIASDPQGDEIVTQYTPYLGPAARETMNQAVQWYNTQKKETTK